MQGNTKSVRAAFGVPHTAVAAGAPLADEDFRIARPDPLPAGRLLAWIVAGEAAIMTALDKIHSPTARFLTPTENTNDKSMKAAEGEMVEARFEFERLTLPAPKMPPVTTLSTF